MGMFLVCVLYLITGMLCVRPAFAQDYYTVTVPPVNDLLSISMRTAGEEIGKDSDRYFSNYSSSDNRAAPQSSQKTTRRKTQPAITPAQLNFVPSIKRRQVTLANIASEITKANPSQGRTIYAFLMGNGDGDIIQKMQKPLSKYGITTTNLADAYAAYWVAAWEASHGVFDSQTERSQMQAVKSQVEKAFLTFPNIANATDADQQAYAEVLLVQAVMIENAAETVKKDGTKMPQFIRDVKKGAKVLGIDVDHFDLTQDGFKFLGTKKQ
jgi:hypothetical protein